MLSLLMMIDLAETSAIEQDANGYRIYLFRYYEDETHTTVMDMTAHVKSVDYDLDKSGTAGDNDEWKLIQQVSVAIYWKEADKDRADTFITYISNPFYEKYK